MERKMIEELGIPFRGIKCGKIRRYFSWENFTDLLKIPLGFLQALLIIREFKPEKIFSKGGYVSFPVVLAGYFARKEIIAHESDTSFGLANKLAFKFVDRICISFDDTRKKLAKYSGKIILTGPLVRKSLLSGNAESALKFTKLNRFKPIILVMGGSLGSEQINSLVRNNLDNLLMKYQIVHICGRGNVAINLFKEGYTQYEFVKDPMKDIYAASSLIVTRGGSNSLAEIAMLKKMAIVIPLSTKVSRGEQFDNATYFCRKFGWTILNGEIKNNDFLEAVEMAISREVNNSEMKNGVDRVVSILLS